MAKKITIEKEYDSIEICKNLEKEILFFSLISPFNFQKTILLFY